MATCPESELNNASTEKIPDLFTAWSLKDELKKNKKLKTDDLNSMREFCSSLPDVNAALLTDEILVALLHCAEYNLEKSREVATKYFEIRNSTPEVFADRCVDKEDLKNALDINYHLPLPIRTPEGYRVFVGKLRDTDPSRFHYNPSCKAQMLVMDAVVHSDPTCPGYIFLYDMIGPGFRHFWKTDFFTMRKMTRYMQEAVPLIIKGAHCVNTSALTDVLVRITRPMIRDELFKLFHFHKSSAWDTVYEKLPRELLPKDFEGKLPDLEYFHKLNMDYIRKTQPILDNVKE